MLVLAIVIGNLNIALQCLHALACGKSREIAFSLGVERLSVDIDLRVVQCVNLGKNDLSLELRASHHIARRWDDKHARRQCLLLRNGIVGQTSNLLLPRFLGYFLCAVVDRHGKRQHGQEDDIHDVDHLLTGRLL